MKKTIAIFKAVLVISGTAYEIFLLWINSVTRGKSESRNFKHRRRWAKRTNRLAGIIIEEIKGSITVPTALVVSNHRTMLDPAVQCEFIDVHIIAKASVGKIPIIGKGAEMTGIVLVKRDKLRSRLAAREMTKQLLQEGKNVLVYAEGTTGTDQTTKTMKIGTFSVAAELGIPVVPVAIEYPDAKDYWYNGSLGDQIIQQIGAGKTRVKLRIGEPIYSSEAKELMEKSQSWIDEQLLDMQRGWSQIFTAAAEPSLPVKP